MTLVKLKAIYFNNTKKDGSPCINKNGSPFTMINIVSENKNKASCYAEDIRDHAKLAIMKSWVAGQEVEITITQSNGFTNFDLPKQPQTAKPVEVKKPEITVEEVEKIFGQDPDENLPF
jgi:hypothetical protein